jgi:hypothetical protein
MATSSAPIYALRLVTDLEPVPPALTLNGARFDRAQQVTVLADGTPLAALGAFADSTRTCGGLTGAGEHEMMDIFPETTVPC